MTNKQLCENFANFHTSGKTGSMHIYGNKLYSYQTVIAQRMRNGIVYLNGTHYSQTTSRQQNLLRNALHTWREINGVPRCTFDLEKYIHA